MCYVAMTRAKSELIMTWRQRATIFTSDGLKTVDRTRSRFLDALVSKKINDNSTKKQSVSMRTSTSTSVTDKARQIKAWSATPLSTQSSKRFQGTARVGSDLRRSVLNQTPRRPQAPKEAQSLQLACEFVGKKPLTPSRQTSPKSSSNAVDASWFFPIGSKVRHIRFGEGTVLPPNFSDSDNCEAVLVAFNSGEQREFPVQTTDLSPVLL